MPLFNKLKFVNSFSTNQYFSKLWFICFRNSNLSTWYSGAKFFSPTKWVDLDLGGVKVQNFNTWNKQAYRKLPDQGRVNFYLPQNSCSKFTKAQEKVYNYAFPVKLRRPVSQSMNYWNEMKNMSHSMCFGRFNCTLSNFLMFCSVLVFFYFPVLSTFTVLHIFYFLREHINNWITNI